MANKKNEHDQSQGVRVGFRLSSDEHARLKSEAEAHGLTLSHLIRSRVAGTKIVSKLDAKIIAELRRQGGLLKHLVQSHGDHMDRAAVNHALNEMIEAIQRIAA